MKQMERYIKTLTPELQEKMRGANTVEDVFRIARQENMELPEEALDSIYGGCGTSYTWKYEEYYKCRICDSKVSLKSVGHDGFPDVYYCPNCLTTKDETEVYHFSRRWQEIK